MPPVLRLLKAALQLAGKELVDVIVPAGLNGGDAINVKLPEEQLIAGRVSSLLPPSCARSASLFALRHRYAPAVAGLELP